MIDNEIIACKTSEDSASDRPTWAYRLPASAPGRSSWATKARDYGLPKPILAFQGTPAKSRRPTKSTSP